MPKSISNYELRHRAKREHILVFALCVLAGFRIFIFSAAFPLFTNIDEQAHFDLVYKYSTGYLPTPKNETYSREVAVQVVLYGSPEYLAKSEREVYPPNWMIPDVKNTRGFEQAVQRWQTKRNHEISSFPVYYVIAGLWLNVGKLLGITDVYSAYWVRFLNAPLIALLVWFSYILAKRFFSDNRLLLIGLPLMVAFFPQDVFYSINNDVLSPLLFAVSLLLLLNIYRQTTSYRYHLFSGLVIAVTLLNKLSNITLLAAVGLILLLKALRLLKEKRFREYLPCLVIFVPAVTIPVGLWLARNYVVFGDLTGTSGKIEQLGWTAKPLADLLNHPIFTIEGLSYFLTKVTKTFWRGELVWHLKEIASKVADCFYVITTTIFILVSCISVFRNRSEQERRTVIGLNLLVVAISVLLLAVLSTLYDYGECLYPSQQRPYLVSGRLISGALLPFLLIYLDGLRQIFSRLKTQVIPLVIVAIIAVAMTFNELWLTFEIFKSRYNFFHLG